MFNNPLTTVKKLYFKNIKKLNIYATIGSIVGTLRFNASVEIQRQNYLLSISVKTVCQLSINAFKNFDNNKMFSTSTSFYLQLTHFFFD